MSAVHLGIQDSLMNCQTRNIGHIEFGQGVCV